MTELYSLRWLNHPDNIARQSEVEFQLESLVAPKDLEQEGNVYYKATPNALITLEQIDEEERRHREASRLQRWIIALTLVMAVAALEQADLISLRTMVELITGKLATSP